MWASFGVNFQKEYKEEVIMAYATFSISFSTRIITLLSVAYVRVEYYTFTNTLSLSFKLYMKAYIASYLDSSGNTNTTLSNGMML